MNTVSKILLGFLVLVVAVVIWLPATQRNRQNGGKAEGFGCGGNCASCGFKNCSDCKTPENRT